MSKASSTATAAMADWLTMSSRRRSTRIHQHAYQGREREGGRLVDEEEHAQEGRRIRQVEGEPAQGDLLDPSGGAGEDGRRPDEAEVSVAQRA